MRALTSSWRLRGPSLRFPAVCIVLGSVLIAGVSPPGVLHASDTLPETMARVGELLANGHAEEARLILERLVEVHPRYGPARLELGRLAIERGSWEEALEQLEIAVQAPVRRQFLAWHLLGRAQLKLGRSAEAALAFDQALSRADRFTPALVGRAGAAYLLGRLETAETEARRAITLGHTRGLAETMLAAILLGAGREQEAGAILSELEDPWEALAGFRRLLEWLPLDPSVESLAARWALGVGSFGAAECFADRALRTLEGPETVGTPTESRARRGGGASPAAAELYEIMARARLAAGKSAEALAPARRAVEEGGERPRALAALGRAALESMRIEEAVAAYRRALEIDAAVIDEIPATGLAALAEELSGEARQSIVEHLDNHAGCRSALYLLGQIARRDQRLEDAVPYFQRLAALEDGSGTRYVLAGLFQRLGDQERSRAEMNSFEARKRAEEAEWLRQNDAFRQRLEAQASAPSQPLEALRIYQALAGDQLATADDYLAAGRILIELDRPQDAREWFEQVLAREPFHREALEALARSFDSEPESDRAAQLRERIHLISWPCTSEEERGTVRPEPLE